MKHAFLILAALMLSLEAHSQNYDNQQGDDYQQQGQYQEQPQYNPPPQRRRGRWARPRNYRTKYNYFKGSMGFASIDDFGDSSGSLTFDSSAVMPINLAYGVSTGNIAFETELGFSAYEYVFNPVFGSADPAFAGDLGAAKLMFNGMFKTSQTGSNFYVGAGLGFVSVSLDGLEDELSGSSLATQFIVGAEIRSNERSSFFIEYKQLASSGLELENAFSVVDFDFEEASLNVGVKLYF